MCGRGCVGVGNGRVGVGVCVCGGKGGEVGG